MLSKETKEVVFLFITLSLIAMVFTFVTFLNGVRGELSSQRTSEIYANESLKGYREFNKYINEEMYGEEVVCAIRDYYSSNIKIRVNNRDGVYEIDKYIARNEPSKVEVSFLKNKFPVTRKYKVVVVYGETDLSKITQSYTAPDFTNVVSGLVFFDIGNR